MNRFQENNTVGEIVSGYPSLSRSFEEAGIDYCCGGGKSLEEACTKKGIDTQTFLASLQASIQESADETIVDAAAMTLTELADHIEATHHNYLRSELPRLQAMTNKVATVHGEKDARLAQISLIFSEFIEELGSHMMKEEQILFPMVRQLDVSNTTPAFHCGSISNPIQQMEFEHDNAGSALEKFRELTDDYTPPDWACNTYRAMLDALAHLERDMHQHVHKENNVLFPRAIAMEGQNSA